MLQISISLALRGFLEVFTEALELGTGGERGIRTPGTRERTIDFESTAFDHSAISPWYGGEDSVDLHLLQASNFIHFFSAFKIFPSGYSVKWSQQKH